MSDYVLDLRNIDRTQIADAGGKGAQLGELARIEGICTPPGFCITTSAFRRVMTEVPSFENRLERLSCLGADDRAAISELSCDIRRIVEAITIPDDLAAVIRRAIIRAGERTAYAVRSSATAEDLPTASFAGQQDSYLNVMGTDAILHHISLCWASLFTERAVTYRLHNGFDHRKIHMAVIVQQMVFPQVSGILFTADPVSGHRKITSVEASFGLGEALVSGRVNPDVYKLRNEEVIAKTIAARRLASHASPADATLEQQIEPGRQQQPALTDAQAVRLAQLGRKIEAHFGCPQDIEWCLADGSFQIVQSRPITTLFPVPAIDDQENHVWLSVGHQQMMLEAMKPLGLSFWQMVAQRPMAEAGGRLFVDVTRTLASPSSRKGLLDMAKKSDPLIKDALETIIARGDFIRALTNENSSTNTKITPSSAAIENDPAIVAGLIERNEASTAAMKRAISARSGLALLDFIREDIQELKRLLFEPVSIQAIMAGIEATWELNDKLEAWLGEKNAADTLTQSAPGNVTSRMGLALLDVADAIRPYPQVVARLQQVKDDDFLDALPEFEGGLQARTAIEAWLGEYGMRGAGEIDITRPRWSERPAILVPMILGNIRNFDPGAGEQRFEQGLLESEKKRQELLARLRSLPDGEHKAAQAEYLIDRIRIFIGYREYPKYGWMDRFFAYKQALMAEAERLVSAHVIRKKEDIFYLTFQEIYDAVHTRRVDDALIRQRQDAFRSYQALTPPRVLTSDGECLSGTHRRAGLPDGALAGTPVSAGIVEGRARVVLAFDDAEFEPGDILVTAYTDPSWTPLFVAIKGLITEVGGQMTHGAVIAREYGLPAVVGVENATRLIRDGQKIRVDGTGGYVEILTQPDQFR